MNYTFRYVRLFPIDFKIENQEIKEIIKQINLVSFCYYYWNNEDCCLDILYMSKRWIKFFLDDVLKRFHYWEIGADESYNKDTIMGQSLFYKTNENPFYNYSSKNCYQADEIRFYGVKEELENYFYKLFKSPIEVSNNCYILNQKLVYTAANDRFDLFYSIKANRNEPLDTILFADGCIHDIEAIEKFGKENLDIVNYILSNSKKHKKSNISRIELVYKNRISHCFEWNADSHNWKSKTGDFWTNCNDNYYNIFFEWYQNQKQIYKK